MVERNWGSVILISQRDKTGGIGLSLVEEKKCKKQLIVSTKKLWCCSPVLLVMIIAFCNLIS